MRHIYIDLGCYDGDSIEEFMAGEFQHFHDIELPVPAKEFEIYGFDPNPNFGKQWTALSKKYRNIAGLSRAAAWIEYEEKPFAVDPAKSEPYGSTLIPAKATWAKAEKKDNIIAVDCFDFSAWLEQFKEDYVIVKMDIEGAEFRVLDKLINQDTYRIVNQLWVETHETKIPQYTAADADSLLRRFEDAGCIVKRDRS